MKALTVVFALSLIFLLASCTKLEESTPVSPQVNSTSLSKAHPVPFKFTFDAIGHFTQTSPISIAGVLEGSGNATHIGKYTSISHDEVYFTSPTTGIIVNIPNNDTANSVMKLFLRTHQLTPKAYIKLFWFNFFLHNITVKITTARITGKNFQFANPYRIFVYDGFNI